MGRRWRRPQLAQPVGAGRLIDVATARSFAMDASPDRSAGLRWYESRPSARTAARPTPTLVFVHGNSSSASTWQYQFEGVLAARYHLLAIDLPGHGDSLRAANPDQAYALPGYAQALRQLVTELKVPDAIFIGWSLGGHIVLEASAALPTARGFVIFGTPPIGKPAQMDGAFLPHPAMASTFAETLSDIEIHDHVAAVLRAGAPTLPPSFIADMRRTDGRIRAVIATSVATGDYRDEITIVNTLTTPLAVLHGRQEQLVGLDYIRKLTMPSLWRGAVQVIDDAGHAPHWETPQAFDALIDAFARDVTRERTS